MHTTGMQGALAVAGTAPEQAEQYCLNNRESIILLPRLNYDQSGVLANPIRHIKKKKLRDLSQEIHRVQLRMHNKKAKRDIPRLQAELNRLFKAKDETMRNNMQNVPKKSKAMMASPKLCPVCNGRIGKGYHICKPGPWRKADQK